MSDQQFDKNDELAVAFKRHCDLAGIPMCDDHETTEQSYFDFLAGWNAARSMPSATGDALDAKRYRWLRDNRFCGSKAPHFFAAMNWQMHEYVPHSVDDAVDAAMRDAADSRKEVDR